MTLKFKYLNGSISPQIGDLTELRSLTINQAAANYHSFSRNPDTLQSSIIHPYESQIDSFAIIGGYQNVYGSIPKEIGNLIKLKNLSLEALKLSGNIPKEIGNLIHLLTLNLTGNQLTGNIPAELIHLKKLKSLLLSLNRLNGNLPVEIVDLRNLTSLRLFYNQLEGTIPASFASLPLWALDLGYNNFEGTIPTDFGKFPFLHDFYLDSNRLIGSIPPNLSRITRSQFQFNVSNNQLSGCYDPALLKMASSIWKDFGCIDGVLCSNFGNQHISDGNNFDTSWEESVNTNAGICWASEISKVWPGDLNNSGVVNNDDIVFYGLAKGNTGFSREGPNENNNENTNWEGQLCPDWDSKVHQINGKHQDANGDGKVDTLDYIVVMENMGLENPDHYKDFNSISYTDNGFELTLIPVNGSIEDSKIEYDLYLESIDGSTEIYGISSTIQFNKPIDSASINFTNSCLDTLHSFRDFDKEKGQLEFALTQVDNVNIDCDNALARLIIIVAEEITAEEGDLLSFKVNGISTQSTTNFNGNIFKPVSVSASANITSSAAEDLYVNVIKSPQRCSNGDKGNGEATAYVSGGDPSYTYEWDNGKTTSTISNLLAGEYTLKVTDKEGIEVSMLVEIENETVYDNDGNVIECEVETETENDCPTDIDFDTNIQNETDHIMPHGIYTANSNICTSAKILKNGEVYLKAGEKVTLKPGFTMEQDTELNVIIQNCKEE